MIYIGLNIKYLRKLKKLSQAEISEIFQVSRNSLSNYETGYTNPDFETLRKMSSFFDVSVDRLLYEDLTKASKISLSSSPKVSLRPLPNVKIVNVDAYAGDSISFEKQVQETGEMYMPDLSGLHYAVNIKGDSMSPILEDGDLAIVKAIEQNEFRDERIYLVISHSIRPTVKRLRHQLPKADPPNVELISTSGMPETRVIPWSEITALYLVVRRITSRHLT